VDALEAILSRRSIRRYTQEPVSDEALKTLLAAAMSAPSAGNEQPWHFIVITDRRLLDEIPRFHPYADMLREAQVAILVCGDTERERYKGHWVQDCSAATQNLLLAAHACGLGAVWVGVYPVEERVQRMQKLFGLPAHVIPLALVPLGHPGEDIPRIQRFDPGRMHLNGWR
jgi:nitroreductase